MTIKILHSADWHIGPYPGPVENAVNLREQDTYNCIESMIETATTEQPDYAVISGDIFHMAKVWSNRALHETRKATEYIKALSQICPVVVLYGTPNHDLHEQFLMLEEYFADNPQVVISMVPQRLVLKNASQSEAVQICTLPGFDRGEYRAKHPGLSREEENQVFTDDLNSIILGLKAQCTQDMPSILIGHYTVPGCNMESGQTVFFTQSEPAIMPETLNTANFDLVALGHIHRPQEVPGCRNTFYSGAINAFNHNDEGQKRGFWIHELIPCPVKTEWDLSSQFYETPFRNFLTIRMNDEAVSIFNNGGGKILYSDLKPEDSIENSIVRVLYSCTDENNKAFNKAMLEKELYAGGAFWVSEIMQTNTTESVNKEELEEAGDPEDNLIDFLTKKNFDEKKIAEIVKSARPIIAEAISNSTAARFSGAFEPVEIEVSNYRNYVNETFNFKEITFCTINGVNGAGKSSLFTDAILDCLYEEPREGELTGWIRNTEDAKSGTITFTFRIGEKTFRVTRTRTKKSGKATLNLSELVKGEWCNRSKEKMRDTQEDIINILGMDSITFRSCAIIMQDQYGVFLQAEKETRMSVLSNLLGLGIYGEMEVISKNQLSDVNRQISHTKSEIERLSISTATKGLIEGQLQQKNSELNNITAEINVIKADKDALQLKLSTKQEAAARALRLRDNIVALSTKKTGAESNIQAQIEVLSSADIILSQEQEILNEVVRYKELLEKEKTLLSGKAIYEAKQKERASNYENIAYIKRTITSLGNEKAGLLADRRRPAELLAKEAGLREASQIYEADKQRLAEMEKGLALYIEHSNYIANSEKTISHNRSAFKEEYSRRITTYNSYKEKAELLKDTDCIDISKARCKFLVNAQEAKVVMDEYLQECTFWREEEEKKIEQQQADLAKLIQKRDSIGYDPEILKAQKDTVTRLEAQYLEFGKLSAVKEQLRLINERLSVINSLMSEQQKALLDAEMEAAGMVAELSALKAGADEYDILKLQISAASNWLDKEKMLPVAKERKRIAEERSKELAVELSDIAMEILTKQQELDIEVEASAGTEELERSCDTMNKSLEDKQKVLNETAMEIGAFKQQLDDMKKKTAEIVELQQRATELSDKAVVYEELKTAFSQDGIPHNIIRSIIPLLATKANSILGQMTGGRMGLEFKMEKVLKSSKKEVVTLDIIIEEYGKGKLAYLSKSGGEKVKSALSVILALAEIKATRSGIQLGMLFIDEPPFLDSDGIQTYCDALEAIQRRYGSIKIMAITHDPTMKARFPQSIDVVKTENGSKVIIG